MKARRYARRRAYKGGSLSIAFHEDLMRRWQSQRDLVRTEVTVVSREPAYIIQVGIFPCSRHALAGSVLVVPFAGITQGQGFEPKNAGLAVR